MSTPVTTAAGSSTSGTATNTSMIMNATMTTALNAPIPPFDIKADQATAATRWRAWVKWLERWFMNIGETAEARMKNHLLMAAGLQIAEVYDSLGEEADEMSFQETVDAIHEKFTERTSRNFERYRFRCAIQLEAETLDEFVAKLRRMAGSCSFRNTDEEVLGQVIFGCRSAKLRRQILEKPDISLTKILQMGRAHEVAELQATEIEGHVKKLQGEEAKFVTAGRKGAQGRRGGGTGRPRWQTEAPSRQWEQRQGDYDSSNDPTNESCGQCGHEPHSEEDCPARGVSCNRCGQRNHYARMCRTGSGRRSGRRGRRGTIRLVTEEGLAGLTVTESGEASEEYGADTMGVEHSWAVSEAPWEGAEELISGASEAI